MPETIVGPISGEKRPLACFRRYLVTLPYLVRGIQRSSIVRKCCWRDVHYACVTPFIFHEPVAWSYFHDAIFQLLEAPPSRCWH